MRFKTPASMSMRILLFCLLLGHMTYGQSNEIAPKFPGCETLDMTDLEMSQCALEKAMAFIFSKLQYPEEAKKKGITGLIITQFMVRKDGTVEDIEIVKGLGYGCDEEVVRVLKLMPKWIPGEKGGAPRDMSFTLPVPLGMDKRA